MKENCVFKASLRWALQDQQASAFNCQLISFALLFFKFLKFCYIFLIIFNSEYFTVLRPLTKKKNKKKTKKHAHIIQPDLGHEKLQTAGNVWSLSKLLRMFQFWQIGDRLTNFPIWV